MIDNTQMHLLLLKAAAATDGRVRHYSCSEFEWRPAVDDGRFKLLELFYGEPLLEITDAGREFVRTQLNTVEALLAS